MSEKIEASAERSDIRRDAGEQLAKSLQIEIGEADMTKLTKQLVTLSEEISEGVLWNLKDNLASWLADHVSSTASSVIEAIIAGNEQEARRYLGLKPSAYYDGRDFKPWFATSSTLHEAGPVELRRKIVEAHRDLITDERIVDLESQLAALAKHYYAMEHSELPKLRDALRTAEHELEQWRATAPVEAAQ